MWNFLKQVLKPSFPLETSSSSFSVVCGAGGGRTLCRRTSKNTSQPSSEFPNAHLHPSVSTGYARCVVHTSRRHTKSKSIKATMGLLCSTSARRAGATWWLRGCHRRSLSLQSEVEPSVGHACRQQALLEQANAAAPELPQVVGQGRLVQPHTHGANPPCRHVARVTTTRVW